MQEAFAGVQTVVKIRSSWWFEVLKQTCKLACPTVPHQQIVTVDFMICKIWFLQKSSTCQRFVADAGSALAMFVYLVFPQYGGALPAALSLLPDSL